MTASRSLSHKLVLLVRQRLRTMQHIKEHLCILLSHLLSMVLMHRLAATTALHLLRDVLYALDLILLAFDLSFEWKDAAYFAAPCKLAMIVRLIKETTVTF